MIKTLLLLFIEYFKAGIFSVGGGYATLPFLYHMAQNYDWFTTKELVNMIAISNVTPGPVGLNMATYAGFMAQGIIGSLVATFAVTIGPFILAIAVIYFLNKFKNSKVIKDIFLGLRPTSCALLSCVMLQLIFEDVIKTKELVKIPFNIDFRAVILISILFLTYKYVKKQPSYVILIGAILGIILNLPIFK